MHYSVNDENYEKQKADWELVETYVMSYKKQFEEGATKQEIREAKESASLLLKKFEPLILKYISVIKKNQIDWNDPETKSFVSNFMDDRSLIRALYRKKQSSEFRNSIYHKFDFVCQTYGTVDEEEMLMDLQYLLLLKARKYQQIGKNFCSYLYNSYKYEVARFIKNFTQNPLNIHYKNNEYEDNYLNTINMYHEDTYHDTETGIPGIDWVNGLSCSQTFLSLSVMDRKILSKYFMEEHTDAHIAEMLGIHINTVNQRRRCASKAVADALGYSHEDIKRTRRSGKSLIKI